IVNRDAQQIGAEISDMSGCEILTNGIATGIAEEGLVELPEVVVFGVQSGDVQPLQDVDDAPCLDRQLLVGLVNMEALGDLLLARPPEGLLTCPVDRWKNVFRVFGEVR